MVYNPLAGNIQTPQQRRTSDPTWSIRRQSSGMFPSSKSTLRTPSSGKNKCNPRTRASPYMTPQDARITLSSGRNYSMELLTPKDLKKFISNEASRRSSPMPTGLPGRKTKYIKFPPNLGIGGPPSTLVSPPMQGTHREGNVERRLDEGRPTVQLLRVIFKCWDADRDKDSSWTVTNGLLNGRNDDRDRSRMWNELRCTVEKVWPGLGTWIMHNRIWDDDQTWFSSARYGDDGEQIFCDPQLGEKASSQDQLGFHMTAGTYDAACNIIQWLAEHNGNFELLESSGVNPFFVIYAFADCNIPLPDNFSRELVWKHLDGILRAKCWRGLRLTRAGKEDSLLRFQYRRRIANANPVPPMFFPKEEDPGDILKSLLRLSFGGTPIDRAHAPTTVDEPVHRLQITIDDYKWVAKAQVGSVWYQAGDLLDDDDIACFAVIDCLTRLLPSCQDGTVEISSDNLPLLWGIGGAPVRAWSVVQAICNKYQVKLRPKWNNRPGPSPTARIEPAQWDTVLPRDPDVVDAVLKEFEQDEELGSGAAYKCMMAHLRRGQDNDDDLN